MAFLSDQPAVVHTQPSEIESILAEAPILEKDIVEWPCTRCLRWVEKVIENEVIRFE